MLPVNESNGNTLHASAVKLPAGGVLLLGPSGSGKSRLAMQLIDHYDAQLIADDRVCLSVDGTSLRAAPPDNLAGLLELRGLGIVTMPYQPAPINLAIDLVGRADVPRIAQEKGFAHAGVQVPRICLDGHDMASAAIIARAIALLPQAGFSPDGVYR